MHMQILQCYSMSVRSFFFLLLMSGGLSAQSSTDSMSFRRLFLSNNVGMSLNPFKPTPTLGLRYAAGPRVHLESSFGYTPSSFWFANEEGETYRGPQVQSHIRYFFRPPQASRYYIGLEHRWQNIRHKYRENYLRQGGAFQQIALAERQVNAHAIMLQFGLWTNIDKRQRWWLDVYWGLGIRFTDIQIRHAFSTIALEGIEENTSFGNDLRWEVNSPHALAFPLGIRLNYAIR